MYLPKPEEVAQLRELLKPMLTESLRDKIATEAMGRLLAEWCIFPSEVKHTSEAKEMELLCAQAYRFADAMLKARKA